MRPYRTQIRKLVMRTVAYGALAFSIGTSQPGFAAMTDISNVPLASTTSAQVKPNIMYLMDTSGSMAWGHMPDNEESYISKVGYKNYKCNSMYYNPNITYAPPKNSDGTNFANQSFTGANYNGFIGSTTVDLSASFKAYDSNTLSGSSNDTAQAAYYYLYSGTQTLKYNAAPCTDSIGTSPFSATGGGTWTKVTVSATSGPGSTDERTNFANWYSYYRTRINMMKSAASLAFVQLTNSYRVGFIIIEPGTTISSSEYLPIADFDTTQKSNWFSKVFAQVPNNSTPLREALSRVGRHYAGKHDGINNGMTGDPVQYSCQQNFTILTTDGYWNGNGGQKIDGSTMDNEDGNLSITPRPMWDGGASSTQTVTDKSNLYTTASCTSTQSQVQQRTTQIQKQTATQITATINQLQQCTATDGHGNCTTYTDVTSRSTCPRNATCQTVTTTQTGASCPAPANTGQTVTCAGTTWSAWQNAASCTSSNIVQCQTTDTGFVNVSSCTQSSGNGQTITCQTLNNLPGQKIRYATTTTTTTTVFSGSTQLSTSTSSSSSSPTDLDGVCHVPTATVPSPNPQRPTAPPPAFPSGCSAWPCTTTGSGSGGSSNSLADVAQYYYVTDLRPTGSKAADGITDVSANNVPSTGQGVEDDNASWQHMTTFTMGLGVSGTLAFRPDYQTATTGDFADIRSGAKGWPVPSADDPTALDDLWHAAVDGRGQFFSAADPTSVIDGLSSALAGINARLSSAAAAATSNLEPVAGDNFAYTAKYVTTKWTGDVEAHEIDLTSGAVNPTVVWSASTKLDTMGKNACDSRTIWLFRGGATNNLTPFTWNTSACDSSGNPTGTAGTGLNSAEQANFSSAQVALLSQYPSMTDGTSSTVNQRTPAAGANLVNFVRGERGMEGFVTNTANALYRTRDHIMGDIVNAQPVYVKGPFANYNDAGYAAFKSANASRTPMVYVAANDGMLHAFFAGTSTSDTQGGVEAWAVIPTAVLPNLYKLADDNYANNHVYSVDGTPSVGDVYDSSSGTWKTILVAGLNSGGKGYYALDITDPASPKGLWEFNWSSTCYSASSSSTWGADCSLGYTFNNPVISKLADGTWVVFVTSGYNNSDGVGYLYVLNAVTGKIIYKLSTATGSAATPSGLNHINNWVDNTTVDNTTLRVYGVDLLGNLWRFDVNDTIAPSGREATLMATAKAPDGTPQPITVRPELAQVGTDPFVFIATGRLVGATDIPDTQVQSIYGIKDTLSATAYTDLRTALKQMTLTVVGAGTSATRTINCNSQCTSTNGWYVDLPDSGERVNVDMKLQLGTLVVASNVPQNTACTIGGYSWLNYLDYATGTAVSTSTGNVVSQMLSSSLAVGINVVRLPSGKTVVITTTSDAKQTTVGVPFSTPAPAGKRISWREISQ